MDDAVASHLYPTVETRCTHSGACAQVWTSRRVAVVALTACGVGLAGAATGADLGGSSKYSSENLED